MILFISRIGQIDFITPKLTSLLNLFLTVGVLIPVSLEILRNDLRPSLNSAFKTAISVSCSLIGVNYQTDFKLIRFTFVNGIS